MDTGGLRAPKSPFTQKGTQVAPQILTDARTREVDSDRRNVAWSPENILVDTVARMQQDLADIRAESRQLRTPGVPPVVHTPRQAAFTTTKVPRFGGTTSWEQYRQVFEAIVLSNGWDDAMAALQLLSHLEGDALNVALLMPMSRQTSRTGLVDALSAHYGSPGRLAYYRRQFEKTTRSAGEDPSILIAIALETLAVKAFEDMGQMARLRLIRDRFIAGHITCSCELRRYLDSVPPETPIRDVVYRCRVWESHADPEIRRVSKPGPEPIYPAYVVSDSDKVVEEIRVSAVTKPKSPPDQVEDLLGRLLAGVAPPAPVPAPVPEVPMVEKLLQCLVAETQIRQPTPVVTPEPAGLETLLRSLLSGQRKSVQQPRQGSIRRDCNDIAARISSKIQPQDPGAGVTRIAALRYSAYGSYELVRVVRRGASVGALTDFGGVGRGGQG